MTTITGEQNTSQILKGIRQELTDFLLFRKDALSLKNSLADLFEASSRIMTKTGVQVVCKLPEILGNLQDENDQEKLMENHHALAFGRLRLYLLLQMTLPEVSPIQWVGEPEDSHNAADSFGDEGASRASSWLRALEALRSHYYVLTAGLWVPVLAEDDIFGFLRVIQNKTDAFGQQTADNAALILVNRSWHCKASVSIDLTDMAGLFLVDPLDNYSKIPINEGILRLTLAPLEGRLFLQDRWARECLEKRRSGILLHPTSLPSNYGIGDMGIGAREFIDFLEASGQKLWQVLPLNPPGYGNSPYQCLSAFAGNPLLIDMDQLTDQGLLGEPPAEEILPFPEDKVSFEEVTVTKHALLRKAYKTFQRQPPDASYNEFCRENQGWLEDYCLFMALKDYHNRAPWHQWEQEVASRQSFALDRYKELLEDEINYHKFLQYQFFRQWHSLKQYANDKGIGIIGDLPIYVAQDSSDVWAHPELFYLDGRGNPVKVAGVPPDEFTRTGQLWGNPVYRWEAMEKTRFKWWKERLSHLAKTVDIIRIDHFRGFEAYWEVPAGEDTAVNGRWVKGPGEKFFEAMEDITGNTEIIAEDLGFITPDVEELKEKFGFPGMKIMQFEIQEGGFSVPLYKNNAVAYTGTHDNDTILGWHMKNRLDQWPDKTAEEICWEYIEMAMGSDADTVIIPMQDILCLGSSARMNTPGTATGNWEWRFSSSRLEASIQEKLRGITRKYRR